MKKTVTKKVVDKAIETLKTAEVVETGSSDNAERKQNKRNLPQLFKPGQSGNPKGRPKGVKNFMTVFTEALEAVAKEINAKGKTKLTGDQVYQRVIESLIKQGINGNPRHMEILFDRVIGKPKHQEGDKLELELDIVIETAETKAIREAVNKAGIGSLGK